MATGPGYGRSAQLATLVALSAPALAAGTILVWPDAPAPTVTVTYEVTGSARTAEVRYEDDAGRVAAPVTVTLPWRTRLTVPRGSGYVTMSATRTATAPGELECRITADAQLIALDGLGGGSAQCTGALRG